MMHTGVTLARLMDSIALHISMNHDPDSEKTGADGAYFAYAVEIPDVIGYGSTEEAALTDLRKDLYGYAQDYYEDFQRYSTAPNRKAHLPYITKILLAGSVDGLKELMIPCLTGRS